MWDNSIIHSGQVGRAVAWSFAAEIAAKLIVPITNMVLARILAPEAFGIIAGINMIVSFADMLSTSGISKYVVQHEFLSEKELFRNADVAFWTNTVISMTAWALIAIFSRPLSAFLGSPQYRLALITAALSLPLTAFSCIQEAVFQRALNYKILFYRRLAVSLFPFAVTIPLALAGLEHWALIFGTLAGNILKAAILAVSSPWKPRFYFSFHLLRKMFSFCFWMLLGAVTSWLITYIDVMLVSSHMGEYYTGLYKNSQMTVVGIICIITSSVSSVLFAALAREQNHEQQFRNILFTFQKNVGIFVIPLGVGIYCFSGLITKILLGSQWMEASHFIGIWGFSTAMVCVFGDFSKEVYKAKSKPQYVFYVHLLHGIFLTTVCFSAIEKGFHAFGTIRALANLELILLHMIFTWFAFKISPLQMLRNLMEPLAAAAVMGASAQVMLRCLPHPVWLQFVYIAVCIALYFSLLCLFRPYRTMLKQILLQIKNKILHKGSDTA